MPFQCSFSMLRTIGRFGITLSVASTLGVASLGTHPVLARARAIAPSAAPKAIASDHPQNHLSTVTAQVPTDSAPTRPQNSPTNTPTAGLRCISGCNPPYPAALAGEQGRVRLRLLIDRNGNVVDAQVIGGSGLTAFSVDANGNAVPKDGETNTYSKLAEAALAATRQMKFAPLESGDRIQTILQIHYTSAGSNFEREARQRRTQNERERLERERQEQLERERQEQLERERQQQQETEPIPTTE
jgi:hypothetical protein